MAMQRAMLVSLAVAAVLVQLGMAANHDVGASSGWDTSSNIGTWAASQTFLVGDNLVFKYTPMHNVVEVGKSDYDNCQATNVIQAFSDGNTVVPLKAPGKRYFICGTPGHCSLGMKLEVNTLAAASSSPPKAVSPASPPRRSSPGSPSPAAPEPAAPDPAAPTATTLPPSSDAPSSSTVIPPASSLAPATEAGRTAPAPSSAPAGARGGLAMGLVGVIAMIMAF